MDDEDRWFGTFQQYRPHGDGVEAVFADLPDAAEYAGRVREVCRAAFHAGWERDAYFVVRTPVRATDAELVAIGTELVAGLRELAVQLGHREVGLLREYLAAVNRVEVVAWDRCNRAADDHTFVHETVGDALAKWYDWDEPVPRMREAFYSVACDYWLAWFLQWPYFRGRVGRDVFRPYFDLWARGCDVAFTGDALFLAHRS